MKITVKTEILPRYHLTLIEFSVLLYYIAGGYEEISPAITQKLWESHWLIKDLCGYTFNAGRTSDIESMFADSDIPKSEDERFMQLAEKLRELFPQGRKEGTSYMWRDSTVAIAKKLKTLYHKYGAYTDDQAIEATKKYIASFNGDFRYMQLLKYFILKKDLDKQEETSQLFSFIQNEDIVINNDNGELI